VIDREQVDGLLQAAGVNGTRTILAAFWKSSEELLATLRRQIGAAEYAEAGRTAHALKGSALNVGAARLSAVARAIEDACKMCDSAAANRRLSDAESRYGETRAALERLISAAR
jgi:protein-histidine pros-kinase